MSHLQVAVQSDIGTEVSGKQQTHVVSWGLETCCWLYYIMFLLICCSSGSLKGVYCLDDEAMPGGMMLSSGFLCFKADVEAL